MDGCLTIVGAESSCDFQAGIQGGLLGTHPLLLVTHLPNFYTLEYLPRKLFYLKTV